jgi:flagellar motor switch protein FliG
MAATINLTDQQKIAILLATLDEKISASIIQQLDPDVMARVADTIRTLGVVPGDIRDKAIRECVRGIMEMGNAVQGDEKTMNSLLAKAIGEKRAAAMLLDRVPSGREAFASLSGITGEQIASILSREQPSVIAVVIRYLPAEKSGEILDILPSDVRKQVIVSLCSSNPPSPEVVARIEEFLDSRIGQSKKARKLDEDDKVEVITRIIQSVSKPVEEELLTAIDDSAESLGKEIRERLFTFEDIIKLNDVAIRRVLQEIDTAVLAVSLRKASIALREKIFKNMSKRASEALKEEMEFSKKMKLSEIQAKQKEIVDVIRRLESEGQVSVGEEGADEYV